MDDTFSALPRSIGSLWNEQAHRIAVSKRLEFTGTTQVDTLTLTGTSGTANVAVAGGLTKLATFDTDLTTTAANFVTSYAADYLAQGIVITSDVADIIFTANVAGIPFAHPTITNVTGDLDGTIANTTANAALADTPGVANAVTPLFDIVGDVWIDGVFFIVKSTLYPSTATPNLSIETTDQAAWFVDGKANTYLEGDIITNTGTTLGIAEGNNYNIMTGFSSHPNQITATVTVADITSGIIDCYLSYKPFSLGAVVTPA